MSVQCKAHFCNLRRWTDHWRSIKEIKSRRGWHILSLYSPLDHFCPFTSRMLKLVPKLSILYVLRTLEVSPQLDILNWMPALYQALFCQTLDLSTLWHPTELYLTRKVQYNVTLILNNISASVECVGKDWRTSTTFDTTSTTMLAVSSGVLCRIKYAPGTRISWSRTIPS